MTIFDEIKEWIYPEPKVILNDEAVARLQTLGVDVVGDVETLKKDTQNAYANIFTPITTFTGATLILLVLVLIFAFLPVRGR